MKEGLCVSVCDEGYYLDYEIRSCERCIEGCKRCNGPTECADEGYLPDGSPKPGNSGSVTIDPTLYFPVDMLDDTKT